MFHLNLRLIPADSFCIRKNESAGTKRLGLRKSPKIGNRKLSRQGGIFLIRLISTFFGIGYLPLAPGTFGSFAGICLVYLMRNNTVVYVAAGLVLLILGIWSSGRAAELFKRPDPKYVVIDEVAGILVSFLFLPYDFRLLIIGFLIFRILDTLKPFPASRLERLHGSTGIMLDDLAAGIYTNVILQIVWILL